MALDSHAHEQHGHGGAASRRSLGVVAVVNLAGFVLELAGGVAFGSVALLGDAVHMLFDAAAYLTAYVAAFAAEQVDAGDEWTFGLHRLEVVSAVLNGILLIPMAGWILWEAYRRLLAPVTIDVVPTLAVAGVGLVVNLGSVLYLHRGDRLGLNERGAFYHLLGDAGGSVAVILGVLAVHLLGLPAVDPVVAALIAVFVMGSAVKVLHEGAGILMQKSPIDPGAIKEAVEAIDGVDEAHDIKSWQVCSKVNVCTIHAVMSVKTLEEAEKIREKVDKELKDRFNLQHVTLQIEQEPSDNHVSHR